MGGMRTGPAARTFLFLSDSNSEAATSRLAVAEIPYIKKKLESGAANWASISAIIDDEDVAAVLVKLTTGTMRAITRDWPKSGRPEQMQPKMNERLVRSSG